VAGTTIVVDSGRKVWGCAILLIRASLVLMVVMAEMRSLSSGLMLTICPHRRPTELQWQEDKQQDEKPASHGERLYQL